MKLVNIALTIATLFSVASAHAEDAAPVVMPELNVIKTAVLSGSYNGNDKMNYKLFLSSYSVKKDDPEIYVNSKYGENIYIEGAFRGFYPSVIADMGEFPLEEVTLYKAMAPEWTSDQSWNFRKTANIKLNHTYSVIIANGVAMGVLIFRVDAIKNDDVIISYAVKKYDVLSSINSSDGLDYDAKNERKVFPIAPASEHLK